jgi:hypothetical protein
MNEIPGILIDKYLKTVQNEKIKKKDISYFNSRKVYAQNSRKVGYYFSGVE